MCLPRLSTRAPPQSPSPPASQPLSAPADKSRPAARREQSVLRSPVYAGLLNKRPLHTVRPPQAPAPVRQSLPPAMPTSGADTQQANHESSPSSSKVCMSQYRDRSDEQPLSSQKAANLHPVNFEQQ